MTGKEKCDLREGAFTKRGLVCKEGRGAVKGTGV